MSHRPAGFPKLLKLSKAAEYRHVFDSAYRSADDSFLMLARGNTHNIARLGLAISKKVLPSSVQRNRIKRKIRESFRQHQQELAGVDVVVLAQKRILQHNSDSLTKSLKGHWEKIKTCADSC